VAHGTCGEIDVNKGLAVSAVIDGLE